MTAITCTTALETSLHRPSAMPDSCILSDVNGNMQFQRMHCWAGCSLSTIGKHMLQLRSLRQSLKSA